MQTEVKVGRGKTARTIVFDDAPVPSRGASLSTRATWAAGYLRRLRNGEKVSLKLVDLALKWIGELVMLR
jgi:hypothetical protein